MSGIGHVLQREDLCRSGRYLVCPKPVFQRVLERLGDPDKLPKLPSQPASINFIAYDTTAKQKDGKIISLGIVDEHCTTVDKVQDVFSSLNLPERNVNKSCHCPYPLSRKIQI